MTSWYSYLKSGLHRTPPQDRLTSTTSELNIRERMKNLLPYFKRFWPGLLFGMLLVLAATLLTLPGPLINAYLIDNVILAQRLDRLPWVILLMGILKITGIAINFSQQFFFARFEQKVLLEIQGDLLERALRFPKAFFDEKETGYLMQRLTGDVQGLRWFFSSTLVSVVGSLVRLVGGVVMLFVLEWRLALVALVAAPILVWSVRYFFGKLHILSHHSMEQQAEVARQVQESLSSTSLIKAFAVEQRTTGKVMGALYSLRDLALEQTAVNWLAGQAMSLAPDLSRAMVFLIGAIWVILGRWQLGELLAFQAYLGYVYGPALSLAAFSLQFQNALTSLERVSALFDILPEENLGDGLTVDRISGEVEFKDVSFSYNGSDPVLEHLSLHVAPGEQVAIVGSSGVGKTTLISLILRFYRPSHGEILFDGLSATEYELGSLRRRIGYVSQSPQLLAGTIMDNLRFGDPRASQENVIQAARASGIHDFIVSLPGGYDAEVGERGANFSEGQKQRLSLARALVKDPDILILDEPTASLDSLKERTIFDTLPELTRGKTVFLVAHRLATVQHADRILLLDERHLVDIGTHNELLERNDYYRSIVESQHLDGSFNTSDNNR
jgi:ABC-type multidrug transport system fused ATPase/permease subunit